MSIVDVSKCIPGLIVPFGRSSVPAFMCFVLVCQLWVCILWLEWTDVIIYRVSAVVSVPVCQSEI